MPEKMPVWSAVHEEREALAGFLAGLSDEQWETASLCGGWTVRDVVAHLTDTARTTRLGFVFGLVAARFDFDRQNERGIARELGTTPAETLARWRAVLRRTSTPPASLDTRLVEAFVHGEDIRRPLGARGDYPPGAVAQALAYQVRTPVSFGGGKQHAAGLTLVGDDADVRLGEGPEVTGPAVSLLVAVSGRAAALDDLSGPGKAELARRVGG